MAKYLAVYKGTAQQIGGFSSTPYDIHGSVEFDSGTKESSELILMANGIIHSQLKGLFAPRWDIERLVEVASIIK